MKTIYNFPFSIKSPKFSILLQKEWKFLDVVVLDEEKPKLYAEVRDGMAKEQVNFQLFGTGQDIPLSATYLTTFSVGPFVFHLYRI